VLPHVIVREDLAIHTGGHVGWAVRRDNPELFATVARFLKTVKKGSLIGNVLFQRYYEDTRWIDNPLDEAEREKLDAYVGLFQKYGERYGFDWRAIAAQAYQESGLDHTRKSRRGAVGLMQVLPSTARDPRVGIEDITDLESNVHAGVKYLAVLRDVYFDDPALSDEDRVAFAWAAYNAGPGNVRRMRARARAMGLDPNRWFHHTEYAALATVGREPVRYVANIYKYYVAYQLAAELQDRKRAQLTAP
jgi:membrane-bound lytic murein transglycosylase MltF